MKKLEPAVMIVFLFSGENPGRKGDFHLVGRRTWHDGQRPSAHSSIPALLQAGKNGCWPAVAEPWTVQAGGHSVMLRRCGGRPNARPEEGRLLALCGRTSVSDASWSVALAGWVRMVAGSLWQNRGQCRPGATV